MRALLRGLLPLLLAIAMLAPSAAAQPTTVEERLAALEQLVGSPPAGALYANSGAPWQFVDRNGKTYTRSMLATEVDDAPEYAFGRIQHVEPWNPGGATTLGIIYAWPYLDPDPLRDHPDAPNPQRSAQITLKQVGVPSGTNRGGEISLQTQRKNEIGLKTRITVTDGGRLAFGDGPHKASLEGDARTLGPSDWWSIGRTTGDVVVTNLTDGTACRFFLDGETIALERGNPARCGANSDGGGGDGHVYLNWHEGYGQYRLINRNATAKVIAWLVVGGLER